ncbi:MAG: stage III sporulation protein AF [Blautia sp.]
MRETIYEWMKNLAVFYLFFTAVMNFLPDGAYGKYIRHFLGLLLILLLATPILQIFHLQDVMDQKFLDNSRKEELGRKPGT